MKKNDENQNNDSGMTRRVYKKASLDDTVVNVRKDPSDDFDLLSDDGMMDYVPGVDDVDHFDFDEKDIEHCRKVMNRKRLRETDAGSSVRWRNSVLLRNSSVKQRNQMNSCRGKDRINRPLRLLQTRFL